MPSLKIVLDTNVLLRSISRRSPYAIILDKLYENAFEIYITNDILLEYEVDIHFNLNLISADPDDNKFSDCAFARNVHFLVTDDKHFAILKSIPFPSINVITLDQFKELITAN